MIALNAAPYQTALDMMNMPIEYLSPWFGSVGGVGTLGYIAGVIYEQVSPTDTRKVPVQRRVLLYHQPTGDKVWDVLSNLDGTYLFKYLDADDEFIIVAIDHTKKWGLEGASHRKTKRSVFDGVTVQYPNP